MIKCKPRIAGQKNTLFQFLLLQNLVCDITPKREGFETVCLHTVLFEIMRPLEFFLTILFLPSLGSVFLLRTPTCYISMNLEFKAKFLDIVLFLSNRLLEK